LARVILLDQEELAQGETGWAQFRLDEAIVVAKGDLFVIRSPDTTLGGGEVVEPHARRHKRFQAAITASLDTLAKGSPEQLVLAAASSALDASAIANHAGLPKNQVNALLIELSESDQMVRLGNLWLATPAWQILKNNVVQVLDAYHKQFPLREGMPREELRSRLKASAKLFLDTIGKLIHDGDLGEGNSLLHLPTHQVHFNPVQEKAIALVVAELRHAGYSPPDRLELERIAGLESEALAALIQKGDLIKVSEDLIYLPETIAQVVERVNDFIISNASITIAEIRDLLGTSRKYALALATFLDEQKITRRVGDTRVRYGQTPQS
jgi:selenocysteine-specific elongation factor